MKEDDSRKLDNSILGNLTNVRKNNLDTLRLIAAFLVIYSHSFVFVGLGQPGPPFYQNTYGGFGITIFLIISGFLITQSYLRSNNPIRYLWGRFIRIFPALIFIVLLTVFVLGPLITNLPKGEYFSSSQTYSYLRMITLYDVQYSLPGVFTDNPVHAVNGSLWILEYQFSFYLAVLFLGVTRLLQKRQIVLGLFVVSLVLNYFDIGISTNIYTINIFWAVKLFTYFSFGMVAYLYRDHIPLRASLFFLAVAMLIIASFKSGFSDILFVFLLGYIVLFIGYSPKVNISWPARFGDFSYGIYIFAYPVQQTVVYLFDGKMSAWSNFLISGVITYILAVLSWFLIEKRVLKHKNVPFTSFLRKNESPATTRLS